MKKFLLLFSAILVCIAVNGKGIYKLALGNKLTFEQALTSQTGVAIVQDGYVLCKTSDGLRTIQVDELQGSDAWAFKFEEGTGDLAGSYNLCLYNVDAKSVGYVNASVWSHSYLTSNTNGEKTNGANWQIAKMSDNKYSIRNLGAVQGYYVADGNGNAEDNTEKGYLTAQTSGYWNNHATWKNATASGWEFYIITTTLVANTSFDFKKITFAEALTTSKSVVIMNEEAKVLNGTWGQWNDGVQVHDQADFDEKNYQLKIEAIAIEGTSNAYTIMLNENGSYNRYLQASVWGHSFFNSTFGDKKGNDGANGAVWTVTEMEDGKYSIRSLGVEQGAIERPEGQGYLYVNGNHEVKIDATSPTAWSFYTIEDVKTVYVAEGNKPAGYLKDYTTQIPLVGTKSGVTISDAVYDGEDLMSATFRTNAKTTNIFQYKGSTALTSTDLANASKIDVQASGTYTKSDWMFVPGDWPFSLEFTNGIKSYSVTSDDKKNGIEDFSIFSSFNNLSAEVVSIHIDGITMYNSGRVFYVLKDVPAGAYRTICLANAAVCLNAKAYQIAGKNGNCVSLEEVKTLEAGKSYFVKAQTAGDVEFVYLDGTAKVTEAVANNGLVGTLADNGTVPEGAYILYNNMLYQVDSDIAFAANRAYVDMSAIGGPANNAKVVIMVEGGEEETAISNVASESASVETIYSANGARINAMQKGVNIVKMSNGTVKKVLVK